MPRSGFRFPFVLCLMAAVALSACSVKAVNPDLVYEGSYSSYLKVYDEWTREGEIYHHFETELVVSATLYSKVYRDALRGERARAEELAPAELAKLTGSDELELAHSVRFLVNTYMPRTQWNNLDQKDPSFRLWLIDADGRRVAPDRIKETKFKRRADTLYAPKAHPWAKNYEVVFPATDDTGKPLRFSGGDVSLVITGVQGEAKLVWAIP